ncbi:MAG TPA: tripartite tricarboxylate transporter substrate binding protein [Burkholderiales bacterium]|jgi:tripartite-type tricarboxylate transporter receptor subunit TctC|nr:tripartite tricarboxylate transporter substrate binding protein [Burkholderiales bacterium]
MFRILTTAIGALLMAQAASPALAQDWPSKSIRMIVPFVAGGSTDLTARVLAENLRPVLGQTLVIDNRPGAAGTIAGDTVAKATPNGYTFLVASATLLANQSLYKNLPYDFIADLAPVVQTHNSTNVLVVNAKVPVSNTPEFIAYVKSGKNKVNYGTAGHGSSQHLAGALFNHMVAGNMVMVPYKGGAPAVTDLVGGAIEAVFAPLIEALPFIKSKAIKPLAVCGPKRSPLLPEVPVMADFLPGYQSTSWGGIMAPAKTPADIVNRMNAAVVKVLNQPNVRTHFAEGDKEPVGNSPAEFKKFIALEAVRLAAQVKISGAKMD